MRRPVWIATSVTLLILVAGGSIERWTRRPPVPADTRPAASAALKGGETVLGGKTGRGRETALGGTASALRSAGERAKPALARAELALWAARLRIKPALARAELALLAARLGARSALVRAAVALGRGVKWSRQAAGAVPAERRVPIAGGALLALVLATFTARRLLRRSTRATVLDLARRGRSTAFIARRIGVEQDGVRSLMRPAPEAAEASGSFFRRAGSSGREAPGPGPERAVKRMWRA